MEAVPSLEFSLLNKRNKWVVWAFRRAGRIDEVSSGAQKHRGDDADKFGQVTEETRFVKYQKANRSKAAYSVVIIIRTPKVVDYRTVPKRELILLLQPCRRQVLRAIGKDVIQDTAYKGCELLLNRRYDDHSSVRIAQTILDGQSVQQIGFAGLPANMEEKLTTVALARYPVLPHRPLD